MNEKKENLTIIYDKHAALRKDKEDSEMKLKILSKDNFSHQKLSRCVDVKNNVDTNKQAFLSILLKFS